MGLFENIGVGTEHLIQEWIKEGNLRGYETSSFTYIEDGTLHTRVNFLKQYGMYSETPSFVVFDDDKLYLSIFEMPDIVERFRKDPVNFFDFNKFPKLKSIKGFIKENGKDKCVRLYKDKNNEWQLANVEYFNF